MSAGLATRVLRAACAAANFNPSRNLWTTLLSEHLGIERCNLWGVHNVTSLGPASPATQCTNLHSFTRMEIQCSSPEQVQFVKECETADRATYYCQGGWEETVPAGQLAAATTESSFRYQDNSFVFPSPPATPSALHQNVTRGFIIARPARRDSVSQRRVCLMYSYANGTFGWTVGKGGCERTLVPGLAGEHRFNTSLLGPCSSAPAPYISTLLIILLYSAEFN